MKRLIPLIILSVIPVATFVITGIAFHIPWWQILLGGVIVYAATRRLIIGLIRIAEYMFNKDFESGEQGGLDKTNFQ